jgi:uncharacterized protein (DUF924 family)
MDVPTPADIEAFRAQFQTLTMATTSAAGEPEVSYAPYVVDARNNFYVFVSGLARHTGNLLETGRASVLFIEPEEQARNVFARRRLTYRCQVRIVPRDSASWRERADQFKAAFGNFVDTLRELADFRLICLVPVGGTYIVGFGQAFQLCGVGLREIVHVDPSRPMTSTVPRLVQPREILEFWFSERAQPMWFNSTPEFDAEVRRKFEDTYQAGRQGQLADWEQDSNGALALIILFDQFPHHIYRHRAESFVMESGARDVARHMIWRGWDQELDPRQRHFVYLPFMHSESLEDQEYAVQLFSQPGLENGWKWARHHRDIVRRFGRFPHRNGILGRTNTPGEIEYLGSKEAFR